MKRRLWLVVFISFIGISRILAGEDCFLVVAGVSATADGSLLMGHNEDNGIDKVFRLRRIERAAHAEGEKVQLAGGGSLPQADTTFAYLIFEMPGLPFSHALLNEHSVAVVSNNCPSREDSPELVEGGIGPDLRILVAQRTRSARDGVKLVGALIERFGYAASGRTLTICDPREGWQVALVNGRHWVARRTPDDQVAILANSYNIHEVNLRDTLNYLGSGDIVDYAASRGWYSAEKDGPFDFERAYARPDLPEDPWQRHRVWSGLNRVAPGKVPPPEKGVALPFSVKPERPVRPAEVMAILRDHYEGTPFESGLKGPHDPPAESGERTICAGTTNHGDVFQLRADLPVEIGALWWIAFWRPCASPFLPLYFGVTKVPEPLDFEVAPEVYNSPDNAAQPGPDKAIRVFRDLALYVDGNYAERIGKVRAAWLGLERTNLGLQGVLEGQLKANWDKDRARMREAIDRYCGETLERAMQQARKLAAGQ